MAHATLAIRPWTFDRRAQPTVLEQLQRVNQERGHFREITTAKLQEEIASAGALQLSDEDDSEDGSEADPEEHGGAVQPRTREELYQLKGEMLQKVSTAHNEVMMALDFISLVESKDSSAGRTTMSQYLKENVPAGTLGTDIWQRMPVDTTREEQEAKLAYNVRMDALQRSADSILSAAKTFESNVKEATRYWEEVLSITDAGWNVCRVPGQRQKLGVRFGFSESGPEFNRGGIAALGQCVDGSVVLDRQVEIRSKIAHITIRKDDQVVGSSGSIPLVDNGSIETEIKHARDSLFDAELFREIEREARTLIPQGVITKGETIVYPLTFDGAQVTVSLELLSHDQAAGRVAGSSTYDYLAQGILSTLKLLLCQAHRDQLIKRSKIPPPMTDVKSERPLLRLLRPLLSLASGRDSVHALNDYLDKAANVLRRAGIVVKIERAQETAEPQADVSTSPALLTSLVAPGSSTASLSLAKAEAEQPVQIKILCTPSSSDEPTSFSIFMDDQAPVQATDLGQVCWFLDQTLSDAVAILLQRHSEPSWSVMNDSLVHRDSSADVPSFQAETVFDGQAHSLLLQLATTDRVWTLKEMPEQDIWQAWAELAPLQA